jgi:hypothetical protein
MDSTTELALCRTSSTLRSSRQNIVHHRRCDGAAERDVSDPPDGMQDQHPALDGQCDRTVQHGERCAARPLCGNLWRVIAQLTDRDDTATDTLSPHRGANSFVRARDWKEDPLSSAGAQIIRGQFGASI